MLCARRRSRSRFTAVALIAIAASLAALSSGCGSSASAGTGTSGAANGGTTSVKLGNPAATYGEAAYVVASTQGYLKKNGINASSVNLSSSSTLLAALVSGGVNFGTTNGLAVLTGRAQGVPVVAICGLSQGVPGLALVVTPSLMKSKNLVVGDVAGDLHKIKGVTVGVNSPTATGGRILAGLVKDAGLPADWIKEFTVSSSSMVTALQHGEIQAYFQDIPVPQESVKNGSGVIAFDTSKVPDLSDIQYNVIAASEQYVQSHKDTVEKFLAGIKQGEAALRAKDPAALKAISDIYPGVDPSVVEDAATTGVSDNCQIPADAWNAMGALAGKYGITKSPPTADELAAAKVDGL